MDINISSRLLTLRAAAPLVHNITNFVVMNNTANALLAVGASPVMAHAIDEIDQIVSLAGALVINIGTLSTDWANSMLRAADRANERQTPWVLDPVGAGISTLRNDTLLQLLNRNPTVIRGNASEILAMHQMGTPGGKGVDSTQSSDQALQAAKDLNQRYGSTVCVSGKIDYVVSDTRSAAIHNGHQLMQKVTGLGCTASALIGAFLALKEDVFQETVSGMAITSIAGEQAARLAEGPGTLQLHFYDCLYKLDPQTVHRHLKIEINGPAS